MKQRRNTMSVKKINENEYASAIAKGVNIIDFNATWCGPCKMLAPVLEKVSGDYEGKVSFYAMDVDDNPAVAQQLLITSIPYVAVFKDGVKVDEQIGFVPEPMLKAFIDRNL